MLDMDEPHEVIAAARGFTGAVTTITGQVTRITDELVLSGTAGSELDRRLAAKLAWINTTFDKAVTATTGRTKQTLEQTAAAVRALGTADTGGGATVRRAGIN